MGKVELRIDEDLMAEAERAGIAVEHVAEAALRAALSVTRGDAAAEARAETWARENAEAIADYNRRIAERGVFSDGLRAW